MSLFSKLAKGLGVASVGAAMAPEEAEAAGLMTIMRRLKVGPEEARIIKEMAKDVMSQGEFDDKVRAIQAVRQLKAGQASKLGSGLEQEVFRAGDLAVKSPKNMKMREFANAGMNPDAISAGATEATGFGAPTNTIRTSQNQYQVQPILNVLDERAKQVNKSESLADLRKEMNNQFEIYKNLAFDDPQGKAAGVKAAELTGELAEKLRELYKTELNADISIDDARALVTDTFNSPLDRAAKRIGDDINRQGNLNAADMHERNIAFTESGEPKIIDTGFFDIGDKGLTPEMAEQIMKRFSGSAEEKAGLQKMVERFMEQDSMKKAAAAAPVGLAMSDQEPQGIDLGEGFNDLMSALEAGTGTTRETLSSIMQGRLPELETLQQAIQDPESAITSEELAAQMGVPDRPYFDPQIPGQGTSISNRQKQMNLDPVTMQDAVSFGVEMAADPTNLIGAGIASKGGKIAKALGRSRRLRKMLGLPTERPAVSAMDEYTKVLGREFDPGRDVIVRDENLYYDQTPPISDDDAMRRFRRIQERADKARAEELAKEKALREYDPDEATAVLDPNEGDILKQEDLMKKLLGED